MAPHSIILAWKIPSMEEPGRLQSMGSLRVGHDYTFSLFTFTHWRRKWQPTPVFLPGESQGQGEPGGLPSMGSHRVGHDWSYLAAETIILSEVSQTNTNIIWCNLYVESKKMIQRNIFIKQKQIYRHRKQTMVITGPKREGERGGIN